MSKRCTNVDSWVACISQYNTSTKGLVAQRKRVQTSTSTIAPPAYTPWHALGCGLCCAIIPTGQCGCARPSAAHLMSGD
jgi:hypothetical protein